MKRDFSKLLASNVNSRYTMMVHHTIFLHQGCGVVSSYHLSCPFSVGSGFRRYFLQTSVSGGQRKSVRVKRTAIGRSC